MRPLPRPPRASAALAVCWGVLLAVVAAFGLGGAGRMSSALQAGVAVAAWAPVQAPAELAPSLDAPTSQDLGVIGVEVDEADEDEAEAGLALLAVPPNFRGLPVAHGPAGCALRGLDKPRGVHGARGPPAA